MKVTTASLAVVLTVPALSLAVVVAGPAGADCAGAGGVTLCSEGDMGTGASVALPYYPYPCEDDWLCANGGLSLLDTSPGGLNTGRDTPGGLYTN